MQDALDIKKRYQTSYWEAAILATAASAGCTELLSEDLNPGQNDNSVRVINPFSNN
jgi:predicted nucleic acid-binding protein